MITLLGSLLGFGTSIVPEILGFFKQGQANKQELAMLEAKAQYAQALSSMKLEELDAKAEIVETEKLYEHDMALAARGGWVVSLQASVRPVITYLFMGTFLAVEGGIVYSLMNAVTVTFSHTLNAWRSLPWLSTLPVRQTRTTRLPKIGPEIPRSTQLVMRSPSRHL